ncbi:hypothetical protein ATW86_02690 [Oenococcus oeni]|nr:hypothetical protein ATW86_02690 [Oenococcus oeni]
MIDEKYSYQRYFRLYGEKLIDNGIPIIKGLYGKLIEKSYKENIKGPLYTTRKNFSKELTKPD